MDREFLKDRFFPAFGIAVAGVTLNYVDIFFGLGDGTQSISILVGRTIGGTIGTIIGTFLLATILWVVGQVVVGGLGRRHLQTLWAWACIVYLAIGVCIVAYLQFTAEAPAWSYGKVMLYFALPIYAGTKAIRSLLHGYSSVKAQAAAEQQQRNQRRMEQEVRRLKDAPARRRVTPIAWALGLVSWAASTAIVAPLIDNETTPGVVALTALLMAAPAVVIGYVAMFPLTYLVKQRKKRSISGTATLTTRSGVGLTPQPHTLFRTHYDNLQVAETASGEVIKGAYRYLSQKYHPDKNLGRPAEAERITKVLNEAYAVLSDPGRRKEHGEWIRQQRARAYAHAG